MKRFFVWLKLMSLRGSGVIRKLNALNVKKVANLFMVQESDKEARRRSAELSISSESTSPSGPARSSLGAREQTPRSPTSRAFFFLLLSTFLLDFAINTPIGALPLALQQHGASITAIAAAFAVGLIFPIFVSIPIGSIVDRIGRLTSMYIGAALTVLSLSGMAFLNGVVWAAILLGVRSVAFNIIVTAQFAYVTDIAAKDRRVSSAATLGMIGNFTLATAPALAVFLWMRGLGREQFAMSALLATMGGLALLFLPTRPEVRTKRSRRIFMRFAWLPAMAFIGAGALLIGVNNGLAVITFQQRGIANGALLFTAIAVTTFALRYPSSRLVEIFGPRRMAIPVTGLQLAGCLVASQAHAVASVVIAGLLLGAAWSGTVPITLAFFFERSSVRSRGIAMGAYNLAFSFGVGAGAAMAAVLSAMGYGYTWATVLCALAPAVVLPFVLVRRRRFLGK